MPFPGSRLPHIRCSFALPLAASPAPLSTRKQSPKPAPALGSGARRTWQHHIYRESQEDLTEKDLQQWLSEWQQQEPVQRATPLTASTLTLPVSTCTACLPKTWQCCMLKLCCCICRPLRLQRPEPLSWLAGQGSLLRSGVAFGRLAVVQHLQRLQTPHLPYPGPQAHRSAPVTPQGSALLAARGRL